MSRENEGPRRGTGDQLEPDAPSSVARRSRAAIIEAGFAPSRFGWVPMSEERDRSLRDADERRTSEPRPSPPFAIDGALVPCIICDDELAEPSTVGTPTCSPICVAVLADRLLPVLAADLLTRCDGSGGCDPVRPPKPRPTVRPPSAEGTASVERARERLGSCHAVLERHGHHAHGRRVFCPFHDNHRTPALSLFEFKGTPRFFCFGCGKQGDAIDLEALLTDSTAVEVIRGWGR